MDTIYLSESTLHLNRGKLDSVLFHLKINPTVSANDEFLLRLANGNNGRVKDTVLEQPQLLSYLLSKLGHRVEELTASLHTLKDMIR